MGEIAEKHIEWAVVHRLKMMLDVPPVTTFNVTQSFALFSAILLWTKNRVWVAGNRGRRGQWQNPADHRAHDAREALRERMVTEEPWLLSRSAPPLMLADLEGPAAHDHRINSDFDKTTAEDFFKWLRDALAHGDGRNHKADPQALYPDRQDAASGFSNRVR